MSQPPLKIDVSARLQRLPPYLFGRINKMKYDKRVAGVDIIDLGMGNPTDPPEEPPRPAKGAVQPKVPAPAGGPPPRRYLRDDSARRCQIPTCSGGVFPGCPDQAV